MIDTDADKSLTSHVPFKLIVEDIFVFKTRDWIVLHGLILSGELRIGEVVHIAGGTQPPTIATVVGLDLTSTLPNRVGLLFSGLSAGQVEVGMVVTTETLPFQQDDKVDQINSVNQRLSE